MIIEYKVFVEGIGMIGTVTNMSQAHSLVTVNAKKAGLIGNRAKYVVLDNNGNKVGSGDVYIGA